LGSIVDESTAKRNKFMRLVLVAQTGCKITFTQTDDKTSTQWISNGILESTGRGYLKGTFGFTDSIMCDLTVTSEGWDMVCASATQQCKLQAQRVALGKVPSSSVLA
jgi:hypothetical protein